MPPHTTPSSGASGVYTSRSLTEPHDAAEKVLLDETTEIAGFSLIERLGRGGQGVVYKALDAKHKRHVALKIVPERRDYPREALTRFAHDVELAKKLRHSSIVTIYEAGFERRRPFIAMELLVGTDIGRHVRYRGSMTVTRDNRLTKGPTTVPEAVQIIRQVAQGLHAAHHTSLFHGDLKPTNVWLTPSGNAKILDFGLAKLTKGRHQTGGSHDDATRRADLFALGCLFYFLLTGKSPFEAADGAVFCEDDLGGSIPPVASLVTFRADVSHELEACLLRLIAPDLHDRFRTAQEFLDDLFAITTPGGRVMIALIKRIRAFAMFIVASVALLLVAVIASWMSCSHRAVDDVTFTMPHRNAPNAAKDNSAEEEGVTAHEPGAALPASLFTFGGDRLLEGDATGTIREWDTTTGREVRTLTGHTAQVVSMALTANGQWLATADAALEVRIWNYGDGSVAWRETIPAGQIQTLWVSPSGDRIQLLVRDGESVGIIEYQTSRSQ